MQRTSDMHPFLDCPYKVEVKGHKSTTPPRATFQIKIIDSRSGEQVEGQECSGLREMRKTLRTRMAYWRKAALRERLPEEVR